MKALGLIEFSGYLHTIVGLDVALKAANVRLQTCCLDRGGIVSLLITGDVAAVNSSVGAVKGAVESSYILATSVIPRPDDQIEKLLRQMFPSPLGGGSPAGDGKKPDKEENKEPDKKETDQSEPLQQPSATEEPTQSEAKEEPVSEDRLDIEAEQPAATEPPAAEETEQPEVPAQEIEEPAKEAEEAPKPEEEPEQETKEEEEPKPQTEEQPQQTAEEAALAAQEELEAAEAPKKEKKKNSLLEGKDLSSMTLRELRALARRMRLPMGNDKIKTSNKRTLIAAIEKEQER